MAGRIDFKELNQVALNRWQQLLHSWLPGGKQEGNRYCCASIDGGLGRSLYVYLDSGRWEEANGGKGGGDLIDLCKNKFNLKNMGDAAKLIERELGLDSYFRKPSNNVRGDNQYKAIYNYVDESGELLFQVVREKNPRPGDKGVRNRRPDGKGGWIYNLGNKNKGDDVRRVLYRLPEVIKAKIVFICEGEKDADNVLRLYDAGSCAATCNPHGAGKWRDEYSNYLSGKTVWIFQDNDKSGKLHAQQVFEKVKATAKSVAIVDLPGLEEKEDVSDYIDRFPSIDEARASINEFIEGLDVYSPPQRIITVRDLLATDFPRQNCIVGKGVLPVGGGLLIAGESGMGKSMLRNELAIHICKGWNFLGLEIPLPRRVFVFQFENTLHAEQTRLRAMIKGLNLDASTFPDTLSFSDPTIRVDLGSDLDRERVLSIIQESGAEVVIFDPLTSLHCVNENDNVQIRRILDNLTEICRRANVTAILIHHFGKPGKDDDGSTQHRVRGGSSIRDWADTVMTFSHQKHETKILRKLEFIKVRNGPEPKPIILERDKETFLSSVTDGDGVCTPGKVREVVVELGGRVDGHRRLQGAVSRKVGCSERAASGYIVQAVEVGAIIEGADAGHSQRKIYLVEG